MVQTIPIWYKEEVLTDWKYRLPRNLFCNRFRGINRLCFQLLCLFYYPLKDIVIFAVLFPVFLFKLILWDWWHREKVDLEEEEIEEVQEGDDIEELYFCQIFRLDEDTDLHVVKVEYCPDETAFIRIVTENSFTQAYKRKVRVDKFGDRYIVFNNDKLYLDPKKTQPKMPQ